MPYSTKVTERFANPKHSGTLDKNAPNVGTGLVGAPACGDVLKLQIEVDEATGVITQAKFKTFGCGSAITANHQKRRYRARAGLTAREAALQRVGGRCYQSRHCRLPSQTGGECRHRGLRCLPPS